MAEAKQRWTGSVPEAEWRVQGIALFGEDTDAWVFRCPNCGNEMSVARARAEFPELKGRGWVPYQECIGRYIDVPAAQVICEGRITSQRCDWAAYGLFRGPVIVVRHLGELDGRPGETPVFAFGAPPAAPEVAHG